MSPDITTNDLLQKGSSSTRNLRPPRKLPSSPAHRTSPKKSKPSRNSPKPIKVMTKCYSEPLIFEPVGDGDNLVGGCRSFDSGDGGTLSRFHTLDDVFSCTPEVIDSPPVCRTNVGYEKDSKVVITVTVEGSPGPIRILVKLGTSVEETIKLVVQKYEEERRTPRLDKDLSPSDFDLHVSYFSLHCLERSDTIGDAGTRSFYLRKKDKRCLEGNNTEIVPPSPTTGVSPLFSARKMNKFERRILRLLKVLGCLDAK